MAPAKKAAAKKATKKAATKKATKKAPAKKATKKAATKRTAKKATKKATKKSTRRASAASNDNVVVASKLRDAVKNHDIRMAGDFVKALNDEVHSLVAKAVQRAKGNKRGTVRSSDL